MDDEQNLNTGKIALWTGAGCIVLVIGMVFGCVFSFGGILLLARPPKNMTALVDAPIQIDNGDQAKIIVNVTNHGAETVKITNVNIGASYLDGIAIKSVIPAYDKMFPPGKTPIGEAFQNYYFSTPVSPGETVSITFTGTAIASGDYGSNLNICIGSPFSCIGKVIRTVVK